MSGVFGNESAGNDVVVKHAVELWLGRVRKNPIRRLTVDERRRQRRLAIEISRQMPSTLIVVTHTTCDHALFRPIAVMPTGIPKDTSVTGFLIDASVRDLLWSPGLIFLVPELIIPISPEVSRQCSAVDALRPQEGQRQY